MSLNPAPLSLGLALLLAAPAAAQTGDGPFPFLNEQATAPTADADPAQALADALRVLGDNPNDVRALETAGRAALECGDPSSSIGFWARADKLEPGNGRVKAGLAAALVQAEEPKRALQLFDQAVAAGVPEDQIADDRGLANDLLGNNWKAQADYRLVLKVRSDPEATRRLALSLAMSGDRTSALATLDPLLRKQDMGAWRARAFVLALTGDVAGADTVAHQVLSPNQAAQIAPFLRRLAALPHAQQAAAVNFGDIPASGRPATTLTLAANDRGGSAPRDRAPAAAPPIPTGATSAPRLPYQLAQPSVRVASGAVDFAGRPIGGAGQPAHTIAPSTTTNVAARVAPPPQLAVQTANVTRTGSPERQSLLPPDLDAKQTGTAPATRVAETQPIARPVEAPPLQLAANTLGAEAIAAGARPVLIAAPPPHLVRPTGPVVSTDALADGSTPARIASHPRAAQLASADQEGPRPSASGRHAPPEAGKAGRRGAAASDGVDDAAPVTRTHGHQAADVTADRARTKSFRLAQGDEDRKDKAAADRKEKAAAKASAPRIWVQVAGGANKHDLGKAWDKLKKASPDLYAGHEPSTTPLRFTNRLLVGPFKTDDEAQAYVNKLTKGGQSGFIVKTDGGQKVEKVPAGD